MANCPNPKCNTRLFVSCCWPKDKSSTWYGAGWQRWYCPNPECPRWLIK